MRQTQSQTPLPLDSAVITEDQYNWVLVQGETDIPIILPKLGDHVPLDVLMDTVFTKAGMDLRKYLALKEKTSGEFPETVN